MVQKIGNNQKSDQGWKISGKYDIFTVEEKRISFIGNSVKRSLGMTPRQREIDSIRSNESKMRITRKIEKEKYTCQILVEKYVKGSYM